MVKTNLQQHFLLALPTHLIISLDVCQTGTACCIILTPSETRPQPRCHCFFESYPNMTRDGWVRGRAHACSNRDCKSWLGCSKDLFISSWQSNMSPLHINAILGHWQAILNWRVFNYSHNWHFVISHHHASHQLMSYVILIADPDIYLHHVPYCLFFSQPNWVRTQWKEFPHIVSSCIETPTHAYCISAPSPFAGSSNSLEPH